jgi:hypothetical protein
VSLHDVGAIDVGAISGFWEAHHNCLLIIYFLYVDSMVLVGLLRLLLDLTSTQKHDDRWQVGGTTKRMAESSNVLSSVSRPAKEHEYL